MKKCPYCGKVLSGKETICPKCFAMIPVEKPKQPKKAEKKPEKE
jgi:uncharacterized OB-fold protein